MRLTGETADGHRGLCQEAGEGAPPAGRSTEPADRGDSSYKGSESVRERLCVPGGRLGPVRPEFGFCSECLVLPYVARVPGATDSLHLLVHFSLSHEPRS